MSPEASGGQGDGYIVLGRIAGVHGIAGWVRIHSFARPRENILNFDPWYLRDGAGWRRVRVAAGRAAAGRIHARIDGVADRDTARQLQGLEIAVRREQLPPTVPGEFYWADLIGLRVVDDAGTELGRVTGLRETGANDVLVVEGARRLLIPFVAGVSVREVDLEQGMIRVDWAPEVD